MKTESERTIKLLKEHRSAVVTTGVTRQIDVRRVMTQPPASTEESLSA